MPNRLTVKLKYCTGRTLFTGVSSSSYRNQCIFLAVGEGDFRLRRATVSRAEPKGMPRREQVPITAMNPSHRDTPPKAGIDTAIPAPGINLYCYPVPATALLPLV